MRNSKTCFKHAGGHKIIYCGICEALLLAVRLSILLLTITTPTHTWIQNVAICIILKAMDMTLWSHVLSWHYVYYQSARFT